MSKLALVIAKTVLSVSGNVARLSGCNCPPLTGTNFAIAAREWKIGMFPEQQAIKSGRLNAGPLWQGYEFDTRPDRRPAAVAPIEDVKVALLLHVTTSGVEDVPEACFEGSFLTTSSFLGQPSHEFVMAIFRPPIPIFEEDSDEGVETRRINVAELLYRFLSVGPYEIRVRFPAKVHRYPPLRGSRLNPIVHALLRQDELQLTAPPVEMPEQGVFPLKRKRLSFVAALSRAFHSEKCVAGMRRQLANLTADKLAFAAFDWRIARRARQWERFSIAGRLLHHGKCHDSQEPQYPDHSAALLTTQKHVAKFQECEWGKEYQRQYRNKLEQRTEEGWSRPSELRPAVDAIHRGRRHLTSTVSAHHTSVHDTSRDIVVDSSYPAFAIQAMSGTASALEAS